ncbi:hypothetical protein GE061_014883 [Apolygus lucorum]|uniref:phosphatidylinositol 3-kinase n=1 Tax=Apolygus lucorum TaxID=248454 RepID=A0A8S9XKK1_APOLU|nr:hypothetical protein GE061_014883 [Apolygus lucorum]
MNSAYAHDFWLRGTTDQNVELSCLLPYGIFVSLEVNRNSTFHDIKVELFEEAAKYPMGWRLTDASLYVFSVVNSMAEREEIHDESRKLSDVKPFAAVLKLVEKQGDIDEKNLNAQISHLIGRGQHEFDALKNSEVNHFRWKMKNVIEDVQRQRRSKNWLERLYCQFPPRIDPTELDKLPHSMVSNLKHGNFMVQIKFFNKEFSFTISTPHSCTPAELMKIALVKRSVTHRQNGHASDFVFKAKGCEEYLVGDRPLIQFVYIQESLSNDENPTLIVVPVSDVPVDMSVTDLTNPPFSTLTLKKGKCISSWNINDPFAFQVSAICRLNCDATRTVEVCVEAGLYHGGKALCETSKGLRSRKLKSTKQELFKIPMCWVNTTVYDFKNQLRTGCMTLYMWNYDEEVEDFVSSLGTVVSNAGDDPVALTVTFHKYHVEHTVVYPSMEKILEFGKENDAGASKTQQSKVSMEQIRALAERDPLQEMYDQEKKCMWAGRYEILRQAPTYLPKLLNCVEWNDHHEVREAMSLLSMWPLLPPPLALELLDYAYADQGVRSYAVKCLSNVSDDDLLLFLLQLVQALKHECYLYCDLVEFLLKRALNNQKMGHYLFWHLRSEMHVPSVWMRFGLMLETYCRGSPVHMKSLSRQLEFVTKMKGISETVRQSRDKDKAKIVLQKNLRDMIDAYNGSPNPLDPTYRCSSIRVESCKVMDSKMRPLWVVLGNSDVFGDDIKIIFKNGDDLRQDMLTLQMIRIMDKLWKNEGHDFRMNPYNCISTDNKVGLIEVVDNAETIANIQKEKAMFPAATSLFRKDSILDWLSMHNRTEASLNKAVQEFTHSCAGYCVATYVLGVADRHSDNIMVKKTGQLFHVDFGHILGHFKEKFGFRRERVPFVLTNDFVHVINKGQQRREALEFQVFRKICEQAFLILRRHGNLILSLFAMMISTGLPELSSENDLNYLRDTLVLDLNEEDALQHFRSKFDEALRNSWKTSLNWASHNMTRNNQQ